jgi:16S rRNA (uracil1498-N3)-methyltransferase
MSERFFSSQAITGDRVTLDGPEAHHLLHVMRASAGDRVTLFDGGGAEFLGEVEKLGRSDAVVRVHERRDVDRELPFKLVVGVALPKGDRQKWLVEKLTELGVSILVPLETERGVAQPTSGALQRLRRSVIEAAKQCGRNRLMEIANPQAWQAWVSSAYSAERRFVAHPGGISVQIAELRTPRSTQLGIGPEGGFTDAEIAAATDSGWQVVDLGPRILRVETATLALTTAVTMR